MEWCIHPNALELSVKARNFLFVPCFWIIMYIVMMAAMNSSRFIVKMPCKSGGSLYLHARSQLLYPPNPVSHASDFEMSVGDVKLTMLMSIPKVDTC